MIRLLPIQLFFLVVLLIAAGCGSSRRSIAVEEGWELLGEEKVNFIRDKDEIEVKSRTYFTAIQFKVEEKDVRLNYLKIHFSNGDKLEPNLNDVITADEKSRIITLGREGRQVDKIEFKYRSVGKIYGKRANVVILGKRYYQPQY